MARARGDSVWLFALDGTLEPVPPGGSLMTFAPAASGPPNVANGETVFNTACVFCHGEQGEGGHGGGPTLQRSALPSCCRRSARAAAMPAFGATLTPEQIRDVAAYVTQKLATK